MNSIFLFLGNLGGFEVVFILAFALMFFGSKSIPKIARGLGKGMREIQNARADITREMQRTSQDIQREVKKNTKELEDLSPKIDDNDKTEEN
jgi:sec-independent protein translocase protein TatA